MKALFGILYPAKEFLSVLLELYKTMEGLLVAKGNRGLFVMILSLVLFWHIYTPIHELLHVLGVVVTGGEVGSLELKPQYGAHLLAMVFDFVVPQSDYAGQLVDFQVPCDLAYYLVDVLPYSLSLFGCLVVVLARRFQSPALFGVAVILCLIPIMSIPGDFYEASSLILYHLWPLGGELDPRLLVHDDFVKLIASLITSEQLTVGIFARLVIGFFLAAWQVVLLFGLQWWICLWASRKFEAISVPG